MHRIATICLFMAGALNAQSAAANYMDLKKNYTTALHAQACGAHAEGIQIFDLLHKLLSKDLSQADPETAIKLKREMANIDSQVAESKRYLTVHGCMNPEPSGDPFLFSAYYCGMADAALLAVPPLLKTNDGVRKTYLSRAMDNAKNIRAMANCDMFNRVMESSKRALE